MTGHQTALGLRLSELHKARARLPLIVALSVVVPPLAGVSSVPVWVTYAFFAAVYGLWALRLAGLYASDRRLGLLLCLTDTAFLLPLLVWTDAAFGRVSLVLLGAAGWAYSLSILHSAGARSSNRMQKSPMRRTSLSEGPRGEGVETPLERAVRERLSLFASTGARFALVMLRVLRFEEVAAYYGTSVADRMLHAVARRGLRLLGPDAQHFYLPGGRVAFLFQTDPPAGWADPYDIEGLAMAVGRKACEHLVDGHRVECVVGWASAPADGLDADDLMYVAETGAQSTEVFRRVGSSLNARERVRAAAG